MQNHGWSQGEDEEEEEEEEEVTNKVAHPGQQNAVRAQSRDELSEEDEAEECSNEEEDEAEDEAGSSPRAAGATTFASYPQCKRTQQRGAPAMREERKGESGSDAAA